MSASSAHIYGWTANAGHRVHPMHPSLVVDTRHSHAPLYRRPSVDPTERTSSAERPDTAARSHYRPSSASSSERRAQRNRERDPAWVPRPPNAFIIFRAEYSRLHAQTDRDLNVPVAAEKTLSKRAAEAWRVLGAGEKDKYKQRAEQERIDHAHKHPDYKYRPRKRQAGGQDRPSRREQVESIMRRAASQSRADSDCESSSGEWRGPESPASIASSSPEPPDTPYRDGSPGSSLYGSRSSSVSPAYEMESNGYFPLWNGHAPSASTPYLATQSGGAAADRKTRSATDVLISAFSPMDYLTMPDDGSSSDCDNFLFFDSSPGLTAPDEAMFERLSFRELSIPYPAATPPEAPALSGSASSSYPASPLFHRRQRSATTSSVLPSPLSVVTSSLADWDVQGAPSVSVTADNELYFPPRSYSSPALSDLAGPGTGLLGAGPGPALGATPEIDFDRTPRRADFPHDVQSTGLHASPGPAAHIAQSGMGDGFGVGGAYGAGGGDFEAYAMGLQELGIDASPLDGFDMFFAEAAT